MGSSQLVWLIPGLPLLGFLFHAFLGKKVGAKVVGPVATLAVFGSFIVSLIVLMEMLKLEPEARRVFAPLLPFGANVPWIHIGDFQVNFGALIDPLSMLMCLIVTGIGGLIHLYATGYMAGDRDFPRFFTYLNLFIFFMLTLVLGENLLLLFVGWEGVGLCSYLLISFWFEDVENSKAGNKAFIVNRIGDVGFALGAMLIFQTFRTLTFYTADKKGFLDMAIQGMGANGALVGGTALAISLLLFIGACGKSAQFPLYVWLPDAMAGPTPVSALIHAATMVTAGVVMVTRVSPIIVQAPMAMTVIACVGIFTAIFAATIALTQNDIKKVLAYSTVSQLGYMFLGCGVGAFSSGMFHVTTHAFFKALLFLGAGSVIHSLSGEQDMRKMGGLKKKIPITYATMLAGFIAIAGIPPFAGFWSKDEILGKASGYQGTLGWVLYGIGILTAGLTAFYMARLMWKTFWSEQRFNEAELGAHGHGGHGASHDTHDAHTTDHDPSQAHGAEHEEAAHGHGGGHRGVHESPPAMWIPLAVLAALSVFGGLMGTPWNNAFERFLEPSVAKFEAHEAFAPIAGMVIGTAVAAIGIGIACVFYSKKKATGALLTDAQKAANPLYQGSLNLWYVDTAFYKVFVTAGGVFAGILAWIDRTIVDGIVNAVAALTAFLSEAFRRVQTGYIRAYAMSMLVGVVAVVMGLLWSTLKK